MESLVTLLTRVKKKKLISILGLCFLGLILFYFFFKKEKIGINEVDQRKIENFDLILSKGQSVQSKLISILNLSTNDYSHIGILIKKDTEIFVLHSTPDGTETNGIRFDDLQTFFDLSSVSDFTILRYQAFSYGLCIKLNKEFETYKNSQVPFDFNFNNLDHTKIYCSELICIIFKNSGLSTFQELNMTKPIYPKYFLKMKEFSKVNAKKTSP